MSITTTHTTGFEDFTNDLGDVAPTEPVRPTYLETCKKCGGSGKVTFGWVHYRSGTCFACKGVGHFERKTSPEKREARRVSKAVRAAKATEDRAAAFADQHPNEYMWLAKGAEAGNDFARSLLEGVRRFGHLTERQMSAVQRGIMRDIERADEKKAREAAAPVVETGALEAAFNTARGAGAARVSLTFGGMKIKPAKETSANAGALYVTEEGRYLGKVMGGRFLRVRECTQEQEAKVVSLLADPKGFATQYGKETGVCCVCNRTLTDPVSVANGIGPICADKMGW